MKTTTQTVDEEFEYLRDRAYVEAEKYERETILIQELFEMEQAKVKLGRVRKSRKNIQHATVTTRAKLPGFLRVQLNNRRLQRAAEVWDRFESPLCIGVPK